ncbi:hypothetical protein LSAT2_006094, partial [Lamellibrachia satsuma]
LHFIVKQHCAVLPWRKQSRDHIIDLFWTLCVSRHWRKLKATSGFDGLAARRAAVRRRTCTP